MSSFKVYLDGNLIVNEPLELTDAELTIERDEDLKGVFFSYSSKLTFYGDGYDYLKAVADADDDCAQVTCRIDYRCATDQSFETLFEGVIPVGDEDVEWNLYECQVKTSIKAADFSDFLNRYGDYKFQVQPTIGTNTAKCIDGTTALTTISANSTDYFAGFLGALTSTGRTTYKFTDVLQQVLSYLSNNGIALDLDPLYTTLYQRQELLITFVDPLIAGDIIDVTFTNYFGQQYTVSQTVVPGSIQTSVDNLLGKLLHFVDSTLTNPYEGRTNYFEKASAVTLGGANTIFNHLPWRSYSISVNGGAKNATLTETQAFQYGLKNLGITNTTLLRGQKADMYVSLNELMDHIAQFHNCGFRMVKTGGSYTFQIRKLESLLDDTSTSVNLNKVPNITFTTSGAYSLTNLTTPDGKADNVFKPITYNTSYCFGDNDTVEGKNYSSQEFFDILNATAEQKMDDELFFVFLKDGDYTEAAQYVFKVAQQNATLAVSSADYFHYNAPYLGALIAARYNINAGIKTFTGNVVRSPFEPFANCTGCPVASIQNTNTKNLKRIYTFDHPLTYSQVRDLITSQLNYIGINDNKGFFRLGFVKKVLVKFKSFVCSFECYAE